MQQKILFLLFVVVAAYILFVLAANALCECGFWGALMWGTFFFVGMLMVTPIGWIFIAFAIWLLLYTDH
jgi:hypothetical protein